MRNLYVIYDTSKLNGPDGISARMLKHTAAFIAPLHNYHLINHFRVANFHPNGKVALLFQFQKYLSLPE